MDLPDPGIELGSPALQGDSLPTELYPNLTKSEAQEMGPGHENFFKFSQMTLLEAKADREPLTLDQNETAHFSRGPVPLTWLEFYMGF